jgi:hypothetical protein
VWTKVHSHSAPKSGQETGQGSNAVPADGPLTQKCNGVTEGTRTPDTRDHNPVLYQLSYSHHAGTDDVRGADQ